MYGPEVVRLARNRAFVTAACVALALTGCSGASKSPSPVEREPGGVLRRLTTSQASNKQPTISSDEIRAAASSPASALLRWWQLIQFSAPSRELLQFYAPASRPSAKQLSHMIAPIRYYFADRRPIVLDQQVTGQAARVFSFIAGDASRAHPGAGAPAVFNMVRQRGRWFLADNEFVTGKFRSEVAFTRSRR